MVPSIVKVCFLVTLIALHAVFILATPGEKGVSAAEATIILDTPEIIAEMEIARNLTQDDKYFLITQRLQCRDLDENGVPTQPPGANTDGGEEYAEPAQVFDNLYYVGGTEAGSWIFTTSEGYIMIDAGYTYSPNQTIVPGMQKLGLDPAQIKYILITHAGPDHVGGAKYFQDNYGTRIVMSEQEWGPAVNSSGRAGGPFELPQLDIIGTDGQTLTLGNTTITIVETPRRVGGGGLSYIAPVFDNGEPHMWATYGNTNTVGTLEDKQVYRDAVAHFLTYTDAAKVDVVTSSHPFVDGSLERMEELRSIKPGETNPFVIGEENAKRFFKILDQCCVVMMGRAEAGLDETGTMWLN